MNSAHLLPAIHDLYSRRPEFFHHEAWELVWLWAAAFFGSALVAAYCLVGLV